MGQKPVNMMYDDDSYSGGGGVGGVDCPDIISMYGYKAD